MKCKILHILMTVALVSISLPGHAEPASGSFAAGVRKKPKVDSKVEKAYAKRRVIGLLKPGVAACPTVGGWTFKTLEDQVVLEIRKTLKPPRVVPPGSYCSSCVPDEKLSEPDVDRKPLHKLKLDRYCIYTPNTSDLSFSPPEKTFVEATPDRLALSITSAGAAPTDDLGQRIWRTLAEQFRSETGQVGPDAHPAIGLTGEPRVRLTFIDSQPDGEWPPLSTDGSQHGFTLAHMAHSLVCPPSGSCAADIKTRRALGFHKFDPGLPFPPVTLPPPDQSGHVGLMSDLAAAIYAEVLYWQQFDPNRKLILNLSLGWDGEIFGDLKKRKVSELEPSVQAVYKALRYARRSGALVIAAAGNQKGGGGTRWPLLPAAWELRRPNLFRWAFFNKPVYAVGGVEWQGLPIPNSRKGGRPRRAAYADHSVIGVTSLPGTPEEPTAMYTGTSVSTAVTSSIAAVVWHLRPELQPAQVMKLITRSGDELASRADFHALKPLSKLVQAPSVRRLSLCPAVKEACGLDGGRCRDLAFPPQCRPWDGKKQPELLGDLDPLPGRWDWLRLPVSRDEPDDIASQRWVVPQPEATPCPGCAVIRDPPALESSNYVLKVQIGVDWKKEAGEYGYSLSSGTFAIDCGSQGFSRELPTPDQGDGLAIPGPVIEIPFNFERGLSGCTAQITYMVSRSTEPGRVGELMSVKNPVVLSPEL